MNTPSPLRPFAKSDWYGLMGATPFADGTAPMISGTRREEESYRIDEEEAFIIVDRYSVSFHSDGGRELSLEIRSRDEGDTPKALLLLVAESLPLSLSWAYLSSLGFIER